MTAQANYDTLVTVIGGTGFLGRNVVRALAQRGYRIRRGLPPSGSCRLSPAAGAGWADSRRSGEPALSRILATATRDASAVVNLVGILYERGRQRFDAVQADGAEAAAQVAAAHRARFVQASAIGADEASTSSYGRTKADGEKRVFAAVPDATIFRPSIMFGPDDDFFNRFAALARFAPALPLVGGGETKFQPVFVGDVAEAIAKAVDGEAKPGTVYELGGPEIFTFKELMEYVLAVTGREARTGADAVLCGTPGCIVHCNLRRSRC